MNQISKSLDVFERLVDQGFDSPKGRDTRESLFMAKRGNFKWTHVRCRENLGITSSISLSFFLIVEVLVFGEKFLIGVIPGFGSSLDVFPILR